MPTNNVLQSATSSRIALSWLVFRFHCIFCRLKLRLGLANEHLMIQTHTLLLFQVSQSTTLVMKGPLELLSIFVECLNQVAIDQQEVEGENACVQDSDRNPLFTQKKFLFGDSDCHAGYCRCLRQSNLCSSYEFDRRKPNRIPANSIKAILKTCRDTVLLRQNSSKITREL